MLLSVILFTSAARLWTSVSIPQLAEAEAALLREYGQVSVPLHTEVTISRVFPYNERLDIIWVNSPGTTYTCKVWTIARSPEALVYRGRFASLNCCPIPWLACSCTPKTAVNDLADWSLTEQDKQRQHTVGTVRTNRCNSTRISTVLNTSHCFVRSASSHPNECLMAVRIATFRSTLRSRLLLVWARSSLKTLKTAGMVER